MNNQPPSPGPAGSNLSLGPGLCLRMRILAGCPVAWAVGGTPASLRPGGGQEGPWVGSVGGLGWTSSCESLPARPRARAPPAACSGHGSAALFTGRLGAPGSGLDMALHHPSEHFLGLSLSFPTCPHPHSSPPGGGGAAGAMDGGARQGLL